MKTAAAFWALLSGAADQRQQQRLAQWLEDPQTFNRPHRVPVLAADEKEYDPMGGYWSGSVWAPTNAMIVLGLEKCGYNKLAKDIARNHLDVLNRVFQDTGTIWENYPPEWISSGNSDHADMVGWSGLAPILYFIQYGVGLSVPEGGDELVWELPETFLEEGSVGCRQYWFSGKEADLQADKKGTEIALTIHTRDTFPLLVRYRGKEKRVKVCGNTKCVF